jgi:integrase/recombinase XerD
MLTMTHRRRTRAYIRLGAYQGLRVHEIAKVRSEDIDVHGGSMTVTGKGGKTALLPLHDEVWELARNMPRTGWWFPSPNRPGHHVDGRAVGKAISDAMQRAGIASGKAHRLRHYFGTELVRSGVNLRIVQTLMRHESPATTAIYTRVTLEEERAGLAALAA